MVACNHSKTQNVGEDTYSSTLTKQKLKEECRFYTLSALANAKHTSKSHAQVSRLREELEEERRLHTSQLHELKFEIDKLRKAKKELEAKYAGVDIERVKTESDHTAKLLEELNRVKENNSQTIAEMQVYI
jgi:hypothetical protein